MNSGRSDSAMDVIAGMSVVAATWASMEIGHVYHGANASTTFDLFAWIFLALSGALLAASYSSNRLAQLTTSISKYWAFAGFTLGITLQFGARLLSELGGGKALFGLAAIVAGAGYCSGLFPIKIWGRLRRTAALVPWLLVVGPVLVGNWVTKPIHWLEPGKNPADNTALVFIVFDELNNSGSTGLRRIFEEQGLHAEHKGLRPSHGSTVEAIPAMFTGLDFSGAKACGPSMVCADNAALDFSRIRVTREDVDVIGFHHPYCKIQGLRSCQRFETDRKLLEPGRFQCGLQTKLHLTILAQQFDCKALSSRSWLEMRDQLVGAVPKSQTMSRGGVLFLHIPIPHPPGAHGGTLPTQYQSNISEAENLLAQMLRIFSANHIHAKFIVTSDHPLRQSMWCKNNAHLFDYPCVVDPELEDEEVPLIVASEGSLPDIDPIIENKQVFELMRTWLSM